jgi:hypothetical protein
MKMKTNESKREKERIKEKKSRVEQGTVYLAKNSSRNNTCLAV